MFEFQIITGIGNISNSFQEKHFFHDTVNSLLMDTSIRRTPGAGPGRFSVSLLQPNSL